MGKTKILRHIGLIAVWAFATISLLPITANAITGGGMSVAPLVTLEYPERRSWFVYEAEPKTVIHDKVEILNLDDRAATINVAALDGAITNDGGYTLVGGVEQNKDVGNWVKLDKSVVTLPAKTKTTVGFTLTVPDNADVGSHAGGIVIWAAKATDAAVKQKGQLQVVTRVAARLYLTVPGDIIRKLDISNVRHTIYQGMLYFHMVLHNVGNVTLLPESDIKLRGIFGRAGQQDRSQMGMLLRGTTINARTPWQKKPPKFGRFVADFRIHYGEKDFKGDYVKDEYQDVKYVFWLIPWIELLWIFVALMLILFIRKFWVWVLIRQRLNTKTKAHTVKKGETLSGVANLYNVDGRKIARFNLLKWPYDLLVGDILLIPGDQMTKEEQAYQKAHPELTKHSLLRHSGLTRIFPSWEPLGRLLGRLSPYKTGKPAQAGQNLFHRRSRSAPAVIPTGVPAFAGRAEGSKFGARDSSTALGMTKSGLEPVIAEAGDTVKTIAQFAGVSERDIIRINQLKRPYKLHIGQELLIPVLEASELEEEIHSTAKPKSTVIKVKSTIHRRTTGANKERLSRRIKKTATSKPISSKRKPKK